MPVIASNSAATAALNSLDASASNESALFSRMASSLGVNQTGDDAGLERGAQFQAQPSSQAPEIATGGVIDVRDAMNAAQGGMDVAGLAQEKTALSSAEVKTQASVEVLSQADQMPKELLRLLRG